MNVELFREVIKQREYVEEISQGEWADGIEACWRREIAILTEDVQETIDFISNDCTAAECSWISEVLDDVVELTQSRELLESYKQLKVKYPDEFDAFCIDCSIEAAEKTLDGE